MCCAADYLILGTDHFAESQVQANAGAKPLHGDHRGMVLVGAAQQPWGGRERATGQPCSLCRRVGWHGLGTEESPTFEGGMLQLKKATDISLCTLICLQQPWQRAVWAGGGDRPT